MNIIEETERAKGTPILVEINSVRFDFHPEKHYLSALCVQAPRVDNGTPKGIDRIEEGKIFTGVTDADKFSGAEEKQYFLDLIKKYRRKTVVIWVTECRDRKTENKYSEGNDRVKGLFAFRAITCPTM